MMDVRDVEGGDAYGLGFFHCETTETFEVPGRNVQLVCDCAGSVQVIVFGRAN